jgi:AraC-like DNA-binding protein
MLDELRRARDPAAFLREPLGRYVADARCAVSCPAPTLCVAASWGRPTERDVRALVRLLEVIDQPALGPKLDLILDLRDVARIDADAVLVFRELLRRRLPGWAARLRRQAVILPQGLTAILLAGAHASLAPAHELRFVTELASACAYLARPDAEAAHVQAQRLVAGFRGGATTLEQLRVELEREPVEATVTRVAAALGLSPRSLQRHIAQTGSSFSDELRRVRVAAASELLVLIDAKVEDIARRVGFASASRMGAAFRRDLGVTPNAVRASGRARVAAASAPAHGS